jgi:hypothetical protein
MVGGHQQILHQVKELTTWLLDHGGAAAGRIELRPVETGVATMEPISGTWKLDKTEDGRNRLTLGGPDVAELATRLSGGKVKAKSGDGHLNLNELETPLGAIDVRLTLGAEHG